MKETVGFKGFREYLRTLYTGLVSVGRGREVRGGRLTGNGVVRGARGVWKFLCGVPVT